MQKAQLCVTAIYSAKNEHVIFFVSPCWYLTLKLGNIIPIFLDHYKQENTDLMRSLSN